MHEVEIPEPLVPAARVLFAQALPLAVRYAALLTGKAVTRGLIGPREAPRIWDRHLLNCAAVAPLVPEGSHVLDVGSGAGLPGIALAIARPDLTVALIDSLARRTTFLTEAVAALALADRVSVVRARAEELVGHLPDADVVTARAVAPLDRLAGWCLPLLRPGGRLLALKGANAEDEVRSSRSAVARLGGGAATVRRLGGDLLPEPTTVVEVVRERAMATGRVASKSRPPAKGRAAAVRRTR